jgi:hypothetical protein
MSHKRIRNLSRGHGVGLPWGKGKSVDARHADLIDHTARAAYVSTHVFNSAVYRYICWSEKELNEAK